MSARTWDLVLWSFTSMYHSFFLLGMGYIGAFLIFFKMLSWNKDLSADYLPLRYGWEAFIFGAMFGTINYLAGQVTKGTSQDIMLMLGLANHSDSDPNNTNINSHTTDPTGQTTDNNVNTHDSISNPT